MSRLFDGVDDRVVFTPGAAVFGQGPITIAALIRPTNTGGTRRILIAQTVAAAETYGVLIDSGDYYAVNEFASGRTATNNAWQWIVMTKDPGSVLPRWHFRNVTLAGAWTHSDAAGNANNGTTPNTTIAVGSLAAGGNYYVGLVAALAVWGTRLSDVGVEAACTLSATDLAAAAPAWATLWNQANVGTPVPDITGGGGNQSVIVGTAVDADEPPGWSYAIGIGGVLAGTVAPATLSASAVAGVAEGVLGAVASAATLRMTGDSEVDEDCAWPVDPSCVPGWDALSEDARAAGIAWASFILKSLTGNRYTLCTVTVRPCYQRCERRTYETYGVWFESPYGNGGSWVPWIDSQGEWRNCGGGCFGACCCGVFCEVWLPGPVNSIESVVINGVTLDPTAYRVDNGELLVRQDGDCWPECSNLTVPPDSTDHTFVVTYIRGEPVPRAGELAGGLLAGEFAKACAGQECAIPERVTSISRQGVNFQLVSVPDEFDDGLTGITEVDRFIRAANPYKLKERPWVSSPDLPVPRMQTWPLT